MLQNIYTGIIIGVIIILMFCFYVSWSRDVVLLERYEKKMKLLKIGGADQNAQEYQAFKSELIEDMKRYNISQSDQNALRQLTNKIVFEELAGQKSIFKKVLNASFYGLLQGGATGFITGGFPGALGGALVFGTVSPIIKTYQEFNPCDESLA